MPPMPCSRTPKRRFRPGSSALKFGSPLTSVRFDSDRSAAPPNSSGTGPASAWIASCDAFRVATSVADLVRLEVGVPAVRELDRRGAAGTSAARPRMRPPRTRPADSSHSLDQVACPPATASRNTRQRVVGHVERLVRVPAVGLLREADLVGAERRAVRLLRVLLVRAAEADVGPDGDQARPVVGVARRLDRRLRWRRGRCRPRPAGCASRRRRSAWARPPKRPSPSGRRAGCGCRRTGRSACPGAGGRRGSPPPTRCPPGGRRRTAMTYVRWSTIACSSRLNSDAEPPLGDGHADRVREALAERAGRRLDAGRQAVLRVPRRPRAPLAERLEVVERAGRSRSGGGASTAAC